MEYGDICISCFKRKTYELCEHCGFAESEEKRRAALPARMMLCQKYLIGEILNIDKTAVDYKAFDIEKEEIVEIREYFPRDAATRDSDGLRIVVQGDEREEAFLKNIYSIEKSSKKMTAFNSSPNIVNIFDSFFENDTVYIVKEYIEGVYLDDFVKANGGKLESETAVSIMGHVLDGLGQLHKEGLIHRGLTPKSIILTANNEVKITNFNFLKEASPYKDEAMTVHFTPGYAPAEQYRSKSKQGSFVDIYSAGAVLYRILTGKKPTDSLDRMAGETLVPPSEIDPNIADNISRSVMKAMEMTAELRFKTANEFKQCLTEKKSVCNIDDELEIIKKKRIKNTVAAVACVLAASAGVLLYIIFG